MKKTSFLLAAALFAAALYAEDYVFDEYSEPETLPCEKGNAVFVNVGNYPVTPCKWIKLSTNSNYMVVCQIAYDCSAFPSGASTAQEIMQTRQIENCLNLGLLKFLQKTYGAMPEAELVRKYRAGFVRAKVEEDFPSWFDSVKDTLQSLHKATAIDDVSIWKVSMRAVGPFAEAINTP